MPRGDSPAKQEFMKKHEDVLNAKLIHAICVRLDTLSIFQLSEVITKLKAEHKKEITEKLTKSGTN